MSEPLPLSNDLVKAILRGNEIMETNNIVDEARELSGILFHKGYGKQAQIIDNLLTHIEQEPKWISVEEFEKQGCGYCWVYCKNDRIYSCLYTGFRYELLKELGHNFNRDRIIKVMPITKPSPPQGIDK